MESADPKIVKALCDELVKAFEDFLSKSEKEVAYLDAMMGCHNFYKTIILDLEERTGIKNTIRKIAIATLREALNV